MSAVTIEGAELHYDDIAQITADKDAPVMVWGHAFLLQASFNRAIVDLLPGHRHITLDFRGHGRSAGVTNDVTVSRMADDAWELVTRLGIDRFIYVGHSMGNAVGMRLASRHPHTVVAAVSLAGVPDVGLPDSTREGTLAMSKMGGDVAALTSALGGMFMHDDMDDLTTRAGESAALLDPEVLAAIATTELYLDESATILPGLTQPWLFIVPGDDEPCPTEAQLAAASRVSAARTVILRGEGHLLPQERPVETATWIRAFVQTLDHREG